MCYYIIYINILKNFYKLKNYKKIPIIAVTAYALDSDKEQFLKEGCSHYLPKPYTKNDLLEIMDAILKESGSWGK